MKKYILRPFFIVICLAFILRIVYLDTIPTGISNDELDYILNAKSVFLSGHDLAGTWNPLTLTTPPNAVAQAEIPPLLTFLLIGPFPLSLLWSKLPYVLINTATIGFLYLISKHLFGQKEAFVIGLVGAINPWLLYFGRTAYDAPISVCFFLAAFYALLRLKRHNILFALPLLSIAFYSYIGAKLLFLPFASIIIFFCWLRNKKDVRYYATLFALCLIIFLVATVKLTASSSRIHELASPNIAQIANTVNDQRRLSLLSPVTSIVTNKYTVFAQYALDKYLEAFSPTFLFLHGDTRNAFSLWYHGAFYYIDIIFLLLGFGALFAKNKKNLALLGALIAISPIPSVVSTIGNSYAIRSMLLAPFLVMLIGVGIYHLIRVGKRHRILVPTLICVVYIGLFCNFAYLYGLRNPVYNSEGASFSGRLLSKYVSLQNTPVYVINISPLVPWKEYIFYTNSLTSQTIPTAADSFASQTYQIGNIHFITCPEAKSIPTGSVAITDDAKCPYLPQAVTRPLHITQLGDAGTIYLIFNDTVCQPYSTKTYPAGLTFADMHVEGQSIQKFCETFIMTL